MGYDAQTEAYAVGKVKCTGHSLCFSEFDPFLIGCGFVPLLFGFFPGLFSVGSPFFGPLGGRPEVTCSHANGTKRHIASEIPLNKTFFAPPRCCYVQMARSYQACLTSASVKTTRCLVDVLVSACMQQIIPGVTCFILFS